MLCGLFCAAWKRDGAVMERITVQCVARETELLLIAAREAVLR